jgi:uncharacterized repeat protein (TIGR01451 family)
MDSLLYPVFTERLASFTARENGPGWQKFCFSGITEIDEPFTDSIVIFMSSQSVFPLCTPSLFTYNATDHINCSITPEPSHTYQHDIYHSELYYAIETDGIISGRISRRAPDPMGEISGIATSDCSNPTRNCICPGDTLTVFSDIYGDTLLCPFNGSELIISVWPQSNTIIKDITTGIVYNGIDGVYLSRNFPLSGHFANLSLDFVVLSCASGSLPALYIAESLYNASSCEGFEPVLIPVYACSLSGIFFEKRANRTTAMPNDTITYTLSITNTGSYPFVNDMWVMDSVSNGFYGYFATASPEPSFIGRDRIEWLLAPLDGGESIELTCNYVVNNEDSFPACGRNYTLSNNATVQAYTEGGFGINASDSTRVILDVQCFCLFDIDRNSFSPYKNESVNIRIMTQHSRIVNLDIYNISGRRIAVLGNISVPGGREWGYTEWDGRDDDGNIVVSGTYYISIRDQFEKSAKESKSYDCGYKSIRVYNK